MDGQVMSRIESKDVGVMDPGDVGAIELGGFCSGEDEDAALRGKDSKMYRKMPRSILN